MRFLYSVIRYVPDPIRGEFINVGAIAGSDESSEWEVRQVDNPARARRLDERGSLPAVWAFITELGRRIDAHEDDLNRPKLHDNAELTEAWLSTLSSRYTNVVQVTPPLPIIADDASRALNEIFEQLIVDPERHPGGDQTKHSALAEVRRAYRSAGLRNREDLHERVWLSSGQHQERIDFAVTNGRVLQLTQTWSFRVADQDALAESVKAWGWTMSRMRQDGATLIAEPEKTYEVPAGVDIDVLVVPPLERRGAVNDALAVLDEVGARRYELGQASRIADVAHRLLSSTHQVNPADAVNDALW